MVDSRGRRVPQSVRGRQFSGPPPGRRAAPQPPQAPREPQQRREAPRDQRPQPRRGSGTVHTPSHRPGGVAIWLLALAGMAVGIAVGAGNHELSYRSTTWAYVFAAPLAAGLVRRGRSLRMLVVCLPLALVVAMAIAAAITLSQSHLPVTIKGEITEIAKTLILQPQWLWGGTALAVAVGVRRGLFRRARTA